MAGTRLKRSLSDLLHYCLLTGWEWWDVLMAAHLGTPPGTSSTSFSFCYLFSLFLFLFTSLYLNKHIIRPLNRWFVPPFLCDLLLNRRTATWNLFVLYNKELKYVEKKSFNDDVIYKSFLQ